MTRHSLLDLVRGLGDPTWFVPGEGPTDLIEIRLMSDDFDTARDAAKSLESRYFIRKGEPPIPPPICIPQEWLIFDRQHIPISRPVKRIHSATIAAAHVWALTMQAGDD